MLTRIAILDCTEEIIRSEGLSALSISRISRIVGIQKSSLFHHSESKSNLLNVVFERYSERFYETLNEISQTDLTAAQKLERYFEESRRVIVGENSICLSIVLCAAKGTINDKIRQMLIEFQDYNIEWLETVFRLGNRDGSLRIVQDPRSEAFATLAAIDGAQILSQSYNQLSYFDTIVEKLRIQKAP